MVGYVSKYTYESIFNDEDPKDDVNFDYIRTRDNRVIGFFWESMFQSFNMRYVRLHDMYFFIYNSKDDELYMKEFKEVFR